MDDRQISRPSRSLLFKLAAFLSVFSLLYSIARFYSRPANNTRPFAQDRLSYSILLKAVNGALDKEIQRHVSSQDTSRGSMQLETNNLDSNGQRVGQVKDLDLQCFLDNYSWNHSKSRSSSASSPRKLCTPSTPLKPIKYASQLCPLLVGRKVLLVGPETSFHLHMHWLHDLKLHENRSHNCLGPEFCNSHQICLPPSVEPFSKGPPSNRELVMTRSASLRYAISTTLYVGETSNNARYTSSLKQVDPLTRVRMRDSYWLGQAKKSDVLILNRGPLPAPSQTYDGTRIGNWTFLRDAVYSPEYTDKRWNNSGQPSFLSALPNAKEDIKQRVVMAALHATLTRFLPSVLETFRILRHDRVIRNKALLWHGSWYSQPSCLNPLEMGIILPENALCGSVNNDYWLLYYNAQVYMQNYLLQVLLPYYGIPFIPQAVPLYHADDQVLDGIHPKNCLVYSFGSLSEETMRLALLTGVSRTLEEL
ncbi:hypothetical protein E1B28_010054 [Marasmius oreades]|uniref:Uncharacterized protein n=1 Tax=Marasmius oreades TaxID=181124 RepID=A0A9P7RWG2_9AGAR|nr:uncharacterized protein E1B28_010054 [Marasmius oreades]KAG7090987.1 hypothetical protein E1B28_010054 [Marasmius oreades]